MIVERAHVQDGAEILALQKLAYQSEAAIYDDYAIPPLTQSLAEITAEFDCQRFLKAVVDGRIVGSVRAFARGATCFIGRLIVHPDYQGRGIGTSLMHAIEQTFEQVKRYQLFTGRQSQRNLYLYQELGYRRFKTKSISERVTLVYLEKSGGGLDSELAQE